MDVVETTEALKARLRPLQAEGLRIGLVPTMGALHAGHLSLVERARAEAEVVVASVFVNPKQFGPGEDLDRYPRDLAGDADKLAAEGVDVLFAPAPEEVYPPGFETVVEVPVTSQGLCGAHRPGHFTGVTTVVLKLLNVVAPFVAVFGEKDYQQLAVIRRMVKDLGLDVRIEGAPIVRDLDGLALSSRNAYLSPEERGRALSLHRALFAARRASARGPASADALLAVAREILEEAEVAPEYLELRDAETLSPLSDNAVPGVMLVAAQVGTTRLIDNVRVPAAR